MSAIEDRLAINDLFVRYTTALDAGDVETVVGCFTADAVLESPVIGVIAGHEAIHAFAGRFAALLENGTQFRHMISNLAAEIEGDRARAACYLLVLITRDGKSRQLPPGRYECELTKEGGEWRFRRRAGVSRPRLARRTLTPSQYGTIAPFVSADRGRTTAVVEPAAIGDCHYHQNLGRPRRVGQ
jgi:ketosteroid isomerase-like protein